ncbi:MAG: HPr kinase/phosphorylase, partial [Pseudoflavonifractor sp.]
MEYSVTLGKLIGEFNLEVLRGGEDYENRAICTEDVNRPGLQLIGFFDYFDPKRIQLIGRVETTYLDGMTHEARLACFDSLMAQDFPALIISRGMDPYPECMEMADKYDRTVLRTQETTSTFMSTL